MSEMIDVGKYLVVPCMLAFYRKKSCLCIFWHETMNGEGTLHELHKIFRTDKFMMEPFIYYFVQLDAKFFWQ